MPETGLTLVTSALQKAGVTAKGRPPDAYDLNSALTDLNDLIAAWNTERWIIWDLLDKGFVSAGTNPITIGPGANIDLLRRPDALRAGYVRQINTSGQPVNTPLRIIPSREEYSRLSLPTLVSFPLYLFLDSSFPIGNIESYPIATANIYEIHVIVPNHISAVEAATDLTVLPPHYIPAFKFNLARMLRQGYGKGSKPDVELNRLANYFRDAVIQSNLQVSELVMPRTLITQSSGYNIFSDQYGNG